MSSCHHEVAKSASTFAIRKTLAQSVVSVTITKLIILKIAVPPTPCQNAPARALRRYDKAIRYADGVPPGEGSDSDEDGDCPSDTSQTDREGGDDARANGTDVGLFLDLKVAILCNLAACHLKLGDGAAALDVAGRACELMPGVDSAAGIKAAYRRACALEALGDWDEARQTFKSILDVDAKNTECSQVTWSAAGSDRTC